MTTWRTSLLLLLAASPGCIYLQRTSYTPVGAAPPAEGQRPSTSYTMRGAAAVAKGSVQVLALDGERLPVGPNLPQHYLRLRLVAENSRDDVTWQLNPNDQILGYSGGLLAPSFSKTSVERPVLAVAPGARGWIDLYYPLPHYGDPPAVTLWWRVRRGAEVVAHQTNLARVSGRDPPPPEGYYPGDSAILPSGLALGWWWPDYCFRAPYYPPVRRYGSPARSYTADHPTWPPAESSSTGDSGSTTTHTTNTSAPGSWRDPTPDSSPPPPPDTSKSAWRR